MASKPEDSEQLNYQTSVLKVSIHCEGCKKKVRKVLQRLEGVYAIDINSKQNKVTVTGNVDAECLIRRLGRYGKHADLWPELKPTVGNSSGDAEADVAATASDVKSDQLPPKTEKQQEIEEDENSASKLSQESQKAMDSDSQRAQLSQIDPNINNDDPKCDDKDKQIESDKKDSEKLSTAIEASTSDEADELKKAEKEHIEISGVDETTIPKSDMVDKSAGGGDILPPLEQYSVYAQPPVYTVSYSEVQPSTSYAYFASSPGAMDFRYMYSGKAPFSDQPAEIYSMDSYYGSMEATAVSAASEGSYDMFNDENTNACNLM